MRVAALHRLALALVLCAAAAGAQVVTPGAPPDAVVGMPVVTPPRLEWGPDADARDVYITVAAEGESAEGGLEAAVLAAHTKLLSLIGLQPSDRANQLFERHLVIRNERLLEDGRVEVQATIPLLRLAEAAALLSNAPILDISPIAGTGGPPIIPPSVRPVIIDPDGTVRPVDGVDTTEISVADPGAAVPSTADEAAVRNALGLDLAGEGRLADAIEAFREACALGGGSPATAEPHNNLGAVYFAQRRYEEARREFQAAVAANPEYALPRYGLGVTHKALGDDDAAATELRSFVTLQREGHLADAARQLLADMGAEPPVLPIPDTGGEAPPPVPPVVIDAG